MSSSGEALQQIFTLCKIIDYSNREHTDDGRIASKIQAHISECTKEDCYCRFLESGSEPANADNPRLKINDHAFLNLFIQGLFKEAIDRFVVSAELHICYSGYLYNIMHNTHDALIQLYIAENSKPIYAEQYLIYDHKKTIVENLTEETFNEENPYTFITLVIKFETLFAQCKASIEKVAQYQSEFWNLLAGQLPNMNELQDINTKIYDATENAEDEWQKMIAINEYSAKATALYGEYLIEIKKNPQRGDELLEKYECSIYLA